MAGVSRLSSNWTAPGLSMCPMPRRARSGTRRTWFSGPCSWRMRRSRTRSCVSIASASRDRCPTRRCCRPAGQPPRRQASSGLSCPGASSPAARRPMRQCRKPSLRCRTPTPNWTFTVAPRCCTARHSCHSMPSRTSSRRRSTAFARAISSRPSFARRSVRTPTGSFACASCPSLRRPTT